MKWYEKKYKLIKIENGISYYEAENPDKVKKRRISEEKRKELSLKRKSREKQPRSGQTKKCNNLFQQLFKDYIKQTSAMGKFLRGKSADMNNVELDGETTDLYNIINDLDKFEEIYGKIEHQEEAVDNCIDYSSNEEKDKFKERIFISKKHKIQIKKWLKKNEKSLKSPKNNDILFEYDIMKFLFNEFKMSENIIDIVDSKERNHIYIDKTIEERADNELYEDNNNSFLTRDNENISEFILNKLKANIHEILYSNNQEELIDNNLEDINKISNNIYNFSLKNKYNSNQIIQLIDAVTYSFLLKLKKQKLSLMNEYLSTYCRSIVLSATILKELINVK